jgi:hypothetical protein
MSSFGLFWYVQVVEVSAATVVVGVDLALSDWIRGGVENVDVLLWSTTSTRQTYVMALQQFQRCAYLQTYLLPSPVTMQPGQWWIVVVPYYATILPRRFADKNYSWHTGY